MILKFTWRGCSSELAQLTAQLGKAAPTPEKESPIDAIGGDEDLLEQPRGVFGGDSPLVSSDKFLL